MRKGGGLMLKKHRYSLGLFWLIAIFVLPLPFLQTVTQGLPALYQSELLAIDWGVIAYVWFLLAIYLGTRPKWLDRLVGLPSMYLLHGILSIAAIGLAYLHKSGTQSTGWIKTTGDWAFDLFLGLMFYSCLFMAGWLTSRVPPIARAKKWLEQVFRHEISVWLHRLNLVAVSLVFIHVQLISYITAITPFMWWFDGATAFVLVTYLWAKFGAPQTWRTGTLIANQTVADNVQELVVQLPQRRPMDLRTGDYVFMALPSIAGLHEMHPFSLVNVPDDQQQLRLAIRGDGDFTQKLPQVPLKTAVKIDGGYGRYAAFLADQPADAPIIILAGGIGVTPLLSVVADHPERTIHFFYTAHRESDLLYPELLGAYQQRPTFTMTQQAGRLQAAAVWPTLPADWSRTSVILIAGPAKMMRYWQRELRRQGVRPGQIYTEEFNW